MGLQSPKRMDEEKNSRFVYLHFTEVLKTRDGHNPKDLANRIYRYELVGNHLIGPNLLLDLPATPEPYHNGGKILIGPDNNLYVVVGDIGLGREEIEKSSKVQNNEEGPDPDGKLESFVSHRMAVKWMIKESLVTNILSICITHMAFETVFGNGL